MIETIDHKALAESRLANQFKKSVNLIAYIKALLSEADTLEQVFQDLLNKRWIDTAEGTNLDILGAIVGQTRELIDSEVFDYFGFQGDPQAQTFASFNFAGVGGRFRSFYEQTTGLRLLNDEEYRLFIRARIARNRTKSTPEDIISLVGFLFQTNTVIFLDGDTTYEVSIGRLSGLNDKSIIKDLDIIPETAGVKAVYVAEFDENDYFGFQGLPNAQGFGAIGEPEEGGTFGNLIF